MEDDERDGTRDDEPAGYGKPPVASRFRKGEVHNKKGRPVKPKFGIDEAKRITRKILERPRTVLINGKPTKMTFFEMFVELLLAKPTSKSLRDLELLQKEVNWAYSDQVTEDTHDYSAEVRAKIEAMARRRESNEMVEIKREADKSSLKTT